MLEELGAQLDMPTAHLRVDVGPAAECLEAASRDATLLVVGGANGRTAFAGGLRASLVRRARCAVAVVPAVPRLGGGEVICGVRDWADVATAAEANRLAHALGLRLVLMHVLPPTAGHGEPPSGMFERPWGHEAAYRLLDVVAEAVGGAPTLRVEHGAAGPRLAQEAAADEAGFLVVGAPTRGRLAAALTGSASSHLMRRSPRPLLVCSGLPRPSSCG